MRGTPEKRKKTMLLRIEGRPSKNLDDKNRGGGPVGCGTLSRRGKSRTIRNKIRGANSG